MVGEVTVRQFKKEDQHACAEHLFRTGMTSIGEPDSNMYKIQKWFTDLKLMEGEDMYDIYAWYFESQHPHRCFWVAEHEGEVVGCVAVKEHDQKGWGELQRMNVKAGMRGKGVADKLIAQVEAFVREGGGTHVVLSTLVEMKAACKLYGRNGYVPDHTTPFCPKECGATCMFTIVTFAKCVSARGGGGGGGGGESAGAGGGKNIQERVMRGIARLRFQENDAAAAEVRPGLLIGSIGPASDEAWLGSGKITHVLSLCADAPCVVGGVLYKHEAGLKDTSGSDLESRLPRCVDYIRDAISGGGCVLVHCFQGKSRSAAVVAAYLIKSEGVSLVPALDAIRSVRPRAQPNLGFLSQLRRWEKTCSAAAAASEETTSSN